MEKESPLKVSVVAEMLGVSDTTIYRMIEEGEFPNALSYPRGNYKTYRIPRGDVDNYINRSKDAS